MIVIMLLGGFLGSLAALKFNDIFQDVIIGFDTALFALWGALIAMMVHNWRKSMLLQFLITMLIINFMLVFIWVFSGYIQFVIVLGGLFGGFLVGLFTYVFSDSNFIEDMRKFSLFCIGLVSYIVFTVILFMQIRSIERIN